MLSPLIFFLIFASPLHSSHKYLLSTHYVPSSSKHLCAFVGAAAAAAKSLQSCPTLCDPIDGSPPGSPVRAKSLQSCPSLCDPMDCNAPGSSAYGTFQARILEYVAIPFSSWAPTVCQISGAQSREWNALHRACILVGKTSNTHTHTPLKQFQIIMRAMKNLNAR